MSGVGVDVVANFIVPVCRLFIAKDDGVDQYQAIELIGTEFFVGSSGFLLTAAHVIAELDRLGGSKVILLPFNDVLASYEILQTELHPTKTLQSSDLR